MSASEATKTVNSLAALPDDKGKIKALTIEIKYELNGYSNMYKYEAAGEWTPSDLAGLRPDVIEGLVDFTQLDPQFDTDYAAYTSTTN